MEFVLSECYSEFEGGHMNISKQIKRYRFENNISQEDLAEILFVSRQTISNWETKKTYPDLRSMLMVSDYFKISLDELVKGDLNMMREKESMLSLNSWVILAFGNLILILLGFWIIISKEIDLIYSTPFILLSVFSGYAFYKVEKIKKDEDIKTYKEIKTYMDNRSLSEVEKEREIEKRKRDQLKLRVFKVLSGAAIAGVMLLLLDTIFKI